MATLVFSRTALLAALLAAACSGDGPPAASRGGDADTAAAPAPQGIVFDDRHDYDLTGDGAAETALVTARGPAWDDLDVVLVIRDVRGDTLWVDRWRSDGYFIYLDRDTMNDATVHRIVRGHLNQVLADSAFRAGPPPQIMSAGLRPLMREAVQYHLAEIDWRGRTSLRPVDPTPPDAHDRIDASHVVRQRVDVVIAELLERPSFSYFAGGEASYVIAWSEREHAFVKIFACC